MTGSGGELEAGLEAAARLTQAKLGVCVQGWVYAHPHNCIFQRWSSQHKECRLLRFVATISRMLRTDCTAQALAHRPVPSDLKSSEVAEGPIFQDKRLLPLASTKTKLHNNV